MLDCLPTAKKKKKKGASGDIQSLPLKQNITKPPTPLVFTPGLPACYSPFSVTLNLSVSLSSVTGLFLCPPPPPKPLKHTPSTLPFPESEINQCWLELSCNKSGPVLDWSLPSQPVTAWPSLRIN